MTNVAKIQVKEALKLKMERLKLSQNRVAQLTGVSNANISHIVSGKATQDEKLVSDKIWQKIYSWVYQLESDSWNSAETKGYIKVVNICRYAQDHGASRGICDMSGGGKTHPLKAYANLVPNVFYVECEEYYTKKGFLGEIIKAMGISPRATSIQEMAEAVINHLNHLNNALLIIDEADKLRDGVINLFKTFYNKTTAGIVLCGAPYFKNRILKGVRLEKQCYQEIFSRIGGMFYSLPQLSEEDVKKICVANGAEDEFLVTEAFNYADGDVRKVRQVVESYKQKREKELKAV